MRGHAGVRSAPVLDPLTVPTRPRPLPPGPIERFAVQAATGSLLATAASLAGQRTIAAGAATVLVGVPKASRTSRESFAGTLSTLMCRRGVLPLDASVWRRLDRVSVVVVDSHAMRGERALVLDAETRNDAWSAVHVWSAAQRLLWTDGVAGVGACGAARAAAAGTGAATPALGGRPRSPPPRLPSRRPAVARTAGRRCAGGPGADAPRAASLRRRCTRGRAAGRPAGRARRRCRHHRTPSPGGRVRPHREIDERPRATAA